MQNHTDQRRYREFFVGLDLEVPLLNGENKVYINLDNAASTPALLVAQQTVNNFLGYYSSVHRGTGFKSQLSTHAYEKAREEVLTFVGANPRTHTCIFGKNTTEALNKLARRFPFDDHRNIVLTSGMEHHSNDLPWRNRARTIHVGLHPDGRLDEADFDSQLDAYGRQIALVAISGASNVTGFINPIHRLAAKAHKVGAQIVVDCAQLAPHRQVSMGSLEDPEHLDYVAISAHKLYAPFGTGALIGRQDTFETGIPDYTGGGTVEIVTLENVSWAGPPDRDEAGSPNTIGAVALAAALHKLKEIGMKAVAAHEADLTRYALEKLNRMDEVQIIGDKDPDRAHERLGVIPFNLGKLSHFLVASILGHEFGIGVRSGCFCAHPYVLHLLALSPDEASHVRDQMLAGYKADMPGLVRASFGLYNSFEEVDQWVDGLQMILAGDYSGDYVQDPASGEYHPNGWRPEFDGYFSF